MLYSIPCDNYYINDAGHHKYHMLLLNFSLCRQVVAINKLSNVGMYFWDYGNAFLHQASLAGLSKDKKLFDLISTTY